MAYQTRDRAPLLDSETQAALEKRGKELMGLSLLGVGLLAVVMLATYSPEDPNWLLASDAPTQNWLGRFGASIAHPLMMIVGRAAWGLPLVLLAWGFRLATHRAEERASHRRRSRSWLCGDTTDVRASSRNSRRTTPVRPRRKPCGSRCRAPHRA